MNWLDFIMLIPACWFGYKGFKNGLINEIASIIALVLGIWATVKFSDYVASFFPDLRWIKIVSFIVLFLVVAFLVFLISKLVEKIIKLLISAIINNLLGLIFGFLKSFIFFSVIFFVVHSIDTNNYVLNSKTIENSFLYKYVEPIFPKCKNIF